MIVTHAFSDFSQKVRLLVENQKFIFETKEVLGADTDLLKLNATTHIYHHHIHCVKSVRVRNYSGSHFPAFELNTERYRVSLKHFAKAIIIIPNDAGSL